MTALETGALTSLTGLPTSAGGDSVSSVPTQVKVNPVAPKTTHPTDMTTGVFPDGTANPNEGPTDDSSGEEEEEESGSSTTQPWEEHASGTTTTSGPVTSPSASQSSAASGPSGAGKVGSGPSAAKPPSAASKGDSALAPSAGDAGPGAPPSRAPFGTDGKFIVHGTYDKGDGKPGENAQDQGAAGPGAGAQTPSAPPLAALAVLGGVVGLLAWARRQQDS